MYRHAWSVVIHTSQRELPNPVMSCTPQGQGYTSLKDKSSVNKSPYQMCVCGYVCTSLKGFFKNLQTAIRCTPSNEVHSHTKEIKRTKMKSNLECIDEYVKQSCKSAT